MRLLLIDNDIRFADHLRKDLEKNGFAVDVLNDGEAASRRLLLNHDNYDIVVSELDLPHKNGIELCRELRDHDISLPVMIIGKDAQVDEKVRALDAGADEFMDRPFSIKELLARIRALLRRPSSAISPELKIKDLILNPTDHIVTVKGNEVSFSLKEFGVLEFLMRNPDQILTRDEILNHVWDFEYPGLSNIVDVHVTNIRKKLKPFCIDTIETVRGVGYRLKKE